MFAELLTIFLKEARILLVLTLNIVQIIMSFHKMVIKSNVLKMESIDIKDSTVSFLSL